MPPTEFVESLKRDIVFEEVEMGKWDKLTAFLRTKGNVVRLAMDQLGNIVGPLSPQMHKRISYWDPFMGKVTLNAGAAAKKADFTVTRFEWKKSQEGLLLKSIQLERI